MGEAREESCYRVIIPRASTREAMRAVALAEEFGIGGVAVRRCRDAMGCEAHELAAPSYDAAATAFELFLVDRARRGGQLGARLRRPFDAARLPRLRANACSKVRDAYSFCDGHGACTLLVNSAALPGDRVRVVRSRPDAASATLEKLLACPTLEEAALAACALSSEPFSAHALLWERVCRPFLGPRAPESAEGVLLRSYWMLRRHMGALPLDGFEEQARAASRLLTEEQIASLAALVPTRKDVHHANL